MKNFMILLLAAVIIGILVFAVFHWLFNFTVTEALGMGVSIAVASIAGELIKPYIAKRFSKNKS